MFQQQKYQVTIKVCSIVPWSIFVHFPEIIKQIFLLTFFFSIFSTMNIKINLIKLTIEIDTAAQKRKP